MGPPLAPLLCCLGWLLGLGKHGAAGWLLEAPSTMGSQQTSMGGALLLPRKPWPPSSDLLPRRSHRLLTSQQKGPDCQQRILLRSNSRQKTIGWGPLRGPQLRP